MRKFLPAALIAMTLAAHCAHAQDEIDKLDMEAQNALNQNDYATAIADWNRIVKLAPDDSAAWYNLGMAHAGKEEPDDAIADFSEDIRLNPDDADAYWQRALIFLRVKLQGTTATDDAITNKLLLYANPRARPAPATPSDEAAKDDSTKDATARGEAMLMRDAGLFIADCKEVIRLDEKAGRGRQRTDELLVMFEGQNTEIAVAYWNGVIAKDPKDSFALANRAQSLGYKSAQENMRGAAQADKDRDAALADYTEALRLDPKNIDLLESRGRFYRGLGQLDKASADHAEAVRLMFAGQGEITVEWARQKAADALRTNDYILEAACWSEVIKQQPDDLPALLARARAYSNSGDKDKAIADYTELLRRQPVNPDVLEARAILYKAGGDDAKFSADHTEAIRIMFSPDATVDGEWAHLKAAEAERTGDMPMALAAWSAVIKNNPDSLNARLARGGDYLTAGDADKAIGDFTEALRIDANNINAMQFRGDAFMRKGDFAKAAEDYSALITAQPGSNAARDFRAAAWLKAGEADKALADAEQALTLVAGDKEASLLRGSALAAKGSCDKALEEYNKLIAAQPDYAPALNAAAQLLATCPDANFRDPAKARELANKACELSQWKDAECIDTLAAAEAAGGDWENAAKHEKQAADIAKTAGVYDGLIKDYLLRADAYGQKKAAPPAKNPVQ